MLRDIAEHHAWLLPDDASPAMATGRCGCSKRRERLNAAVPFCRPIDGPLKAV